MINHKHWHYERHWEWQPIKARKIEVLEFIDGNDIVTSHDLMNEFGYTYNSARCRLSQLRKDGYVEPLLRGQWCLANRGYDKIYYLRSLKEKVEGGKPEQEKELRRLKRRVEEVESRLSLVHQRLVRVSQEINGMTVSQLTRKGAGLELEHWRGRLVRLVAEATELIRQGK